MILLPVNFVNVNFLKQIINVKSTEVDEDINIIGIGIEWSTCSENGEFLGIAYVDEFNLKIRVCKFGKKVIDLLKIFKSFKTNVNTPRAILNISA